MSFLSFFLRRFVSGAVARSLTNFLSKRFRMSPGAANIVFVVLTELFARGTERVAPAAGGRKGFPRR